MERIQPFLPKAFSILKATAFRTEPENAGDLRCLEDSVQDIYNIWK